jgi:hypothetical protein
MQAYRARYERGRVIPFGNPKIPEGSDIILTVLDPAVMEDPLEKQRRAVKEFLEGIRNCDEPLGSEFDEVISKRFNIARELDL